MSEPVSEARLLESASLINRNAYRSKQIQQQQKSDRAQEQAATVLGYDGVTGQVKVKDNNGRIFYAKAITNSSGLSIGSQVSLVIANGIPIIDAMPR
ncbi:MAG: hypothetical protein ICV78_20440 [Tolypothrix sp. Co-bin9]|nr:hypothetical protein [Tolypothrix sp. Co-bin9]